MGLSDAAVEVPLPSEVGSAGTGSATLDAGGDASDDMAGTAGGDVPQKAALDGHRAWSNFEGVGGAERTTDMLNHTLLVPTTQPADVLAEDPAALA